MLSPDNIDIQWLERKMPGFLAMSRIAKKVRESENAYREAIKQGRSYDPIKPVAY